MIMKMQIMVFSLHSVTTQNTMTRTINNLLEHIRLTMRNY